MGFPETWELLCFLFLSRKFLSKLGWVLPGSQKSTFSPSRPASPNSPHLLVTRKSRSRGAQGIPGSPHLLPWDCCQNALQAQMLSRGCPWANYHQSVILSSLEISSSDVNIGPDLHLQLVFHSNCPSDVFTLYPVGFLSSRKTPPKLNVTSSPIFFFHISYLQEWLCHPCRLTPRLQIPLFTDSFPQDASQD